MKNFLRKVLDIRVLSVIFAIALWYYVIGVQGPTIERSFEGVPVVPLNIPSESFIVNEIEPVTIYAEGPSKVILGIKPTDFTAVVNLSGKETGEYYLNVEVRSPLSNITVESYTPSTVKVEIEKLSSITLPVSVAFENVSETFFPENPNVFPSTVTVFGPESRLKDVEKVFVSVDLKNAKEGDSLNLPVQLSVKEGTVENLYVSPSTCIVQLLSAKNEVINIVPVIPDVMGSPYSGFGIRSVSVTPSTITLRGDIKIVSQIKSVKTKTVDVSNLTKNTDIKVELVVPEGVSVMGETQCTVRVGIEAFSTRSFKILLTVLHGSDRTATTNIDAVELVLIGFKDILDSFDYSALKVNVDATNLLPGRYELPITVSGLPSGVFVSTINPSSAEVIIY